MNRVDYAEILDLFCWGLDKLARPTLANLLAGYDEYAHRRQATQVILRLEQQQLISRTSGKKIVFAITDAGRQRVARTDPRREWERPWDGGWRVVTFDLPEVRRKDRWRLWQALRARNLGLLQRSVWIWPHDLTAVLTEIIQIKGLPECFCGFTATQLFLCTHSEVVATAWDWEEITRRHNTYLKHLVANVTALQAATNHAALARIARIERQACAYALARDPLLPRSLWPQSYLGHAVWDRHLEFRDRLRKQFARLTTD